MPQKITLTVNGRGHRLDLEPDTPLIYVLRNDLGLKGAKFGCGTGQCGACTVLIDGQPRPSCRLPVASVAGREITTIEGLGTTDALDPVQQAFIDENAVQCGFCTPGMILAARALLNRHAQPTDEQILAALNRNLCRCGVYDRMRRAIRRAAGWPVEGGPYELRSEALPGVDEPLPGPLLHTPDIDAWVRIDADRTVTVITGKAELGQDLRTAVAMIGAEELDVSLDRVRVIMADTGQSPDEGYTSSSVSLETSGNALRYAAAEARHIMLSEAHEELEAPLERLTVCDGTITDPVTGRSVTYWELHGGRRFGRPVTGTIRPKRADSYEIVGHPQPRIDLTSKVKGRGIFVHDMELPGMVHGRIVRPPGYDARLLSVDLAEAEGMPGVIRVKRDGSFLGVIAAREEQAVAAAKALHSSATWQNDTDLPPQETLIEHMLNQPQQAYLLVDGTPTPGPVPPIEAPPEAAQTISATYFRPFHSHASLGPSAAVGLLDEDRLTVWTHSQGVYPVRVSLAHALDMPPEAIRCIHVDGAGGFGHNGADDAALDAALLACAVPGRPVSLKWSRADENAWEPYGPATVLQLQGSLDAENRVIDWNHDVWGYTHTLHPRPRGEMNPLLAAWHLAHPLKMPQAKPLLSAQTGIHRNALPLYTFCRDIPDTVGERHDVHARPRIVKHFLPDSPLRTSTLRGLGSYANVFAMESFMDEMARAAGEDPVAFRLRYMAEERARAVIEAAAKKANWQPATRPRGNGRGRGFAFAQYKNRQVYMAAVVDLSVHRASGQVRLERVVIAADAGQIVNPEGLSSQVEGAFAQSASWTLKEQVTFDRRSVTSTDWNSYPILRFGETPEIEVVLLNRPGSPFLGVGEGAMGPAPAAIANAIYDAVGVRMRTIPFTPERVKAALGEN